MLFINFAILKAFRYVENTGRWLLGASKARKVFYDAAPIVAENALHLRQVAVFFSNIGHHVFVKHKVFNLVQKWNHPFYKKRTIWFLTFYHLEDIARNDGWDAQIHFIVHMSFQRTRRFILI